MCLHAWQQHMHNYIKTQIHTVKHCCTNGTDTSKRFSFPQPTFKAHITGLLSRRRRHPLGWLARVRSVLYKKNTQCSETLSSFILTDLKKIKDKDNKNAKKSSIHMHRGRLGIRVNLSLFSTKGDQKTQWILLYICTKHSQTLFHCLTVV